MEVAPVANRSKGKIWNALTLALGLSCMVLSRRAGKNSSGDFESVFGSLILSDLISRVDAPSIPFSGRKRIIKMLVLRFRRESREVILHLLEPGLPSRPLVDNHQMVTICTTTTQDTQQSLIYLLRIS